MYLQRINSSRRRFLAVWKRSGYDSDSTRLAIWPAPISSIILKCSTTVHADTAIWVGSVPRLLNRASLWGQEMSTVLGAVHCEILRKILQTHWCSRSVSTGINQWFASMVFPLPRLISRLLTVPQNRLRCMTGSLDIIRRLTTINKVDAWPQRYCFKITGKIYLKLQCTLTTNTEGIIIPLSIAKKSVKLYW